jgi:hypothetical protein
MAVSNAPPMQAAVRSLIPGVFPIMPAILSTLEGALKGRQIFANGTNQAQITAHQSQGIRAQQNPGKLIAIWVQKKGKVGCKKQERRSFAAPPPCAMSSLSPVRDDQSAIAETFRSLDHALGSHGFP